MARSRDVGIHEGTLPTHLCLVTSLFPWQRLTPTCPCTLLTQGREPGSLQELLVQSLSHQAKAWVISPNFPGCRIGSSTLTIILEPPEASGSGAEPRHILPCLVTYSQWVLWTSKSPSARSLLEVQTRRPDLRNVHFNKICRGCVCIKTQERCSRKTATGKPRFSHLWKRSKRLRITVSPPLQKVLPGSDQAGEAPGVRTHTVPSGHRIALLLS